MSETLQTLLYKSILSGIADHSSALLFSGGIDSAVVLNLLMDNHIKPKMYALKMDKVESDDYKAFNVVAKTFKFKNKAITIKESANLSKYKNFLIDNGIPKNKRASLLVMSLFCKLIDNVKEDAIYTGLGSDAYYGLGRNFAIQCSLRGEKIPSLKSMQSFREKTFSHYREQLVAITRYADSKGKHLIAPFMTPEVCYYFMDKTFEECNKPRAKQILINLYPMYFRIFGARKPSNFHCGNSEFKRIKI